jgi:hypothetical protein
VRALTINLKSKLGWETGQGRKELVKNQSKKNGAYKKKIEKRMAQKLSWKNQPRKKIAKDKQANKGIN